MYLYIFENQAIQVDDAGPTDVDFLMIDDGTLRVLEIVGGDVKEILSPELSDSLPRCTIDSDAGYEFHVEAVE